MLDKLIGYLRSGNWIGVMELVPEFKACIGQLQYKKAGVTVAEHIQLAVSRARELDDFMLLLAFFHDIAKPQVAVPTEFNFPGHWDASAEMASNILTRLGCSPDGLYLGRLEKAIRLHHDPHNGKIPPLDMDDARRVIDFAEIDSMSFANPKFDDIKKRFDDLRAQIK